jgi:hypothetical protein
VADLVPAWVVKLSPILTMAAVFLVAAHAFLVRAQLDPIARLLLSIPGVILLGEGYRYAKNPGDRELPANVIGLVYYYVAFSFPAFFDMVFYDMRGPVAFSERAYSLGSAAVAMGGLFLYGGMRAGELLGARLRPGLESLSPPSDLSPAMQQATFWYAGLCTALTLIFISAPTLIPGELGVFITNTIAFDFCVGLTVAMPLYFQGKWSKYGSLFVLGLGSVGGLIRGVLDPAMRLGVAAIAGGWANTRRFAVRLAAGFLAVYVLLQPIKQDFRQQIWRSRDQSAVSYTDRINAWVNALSGFWSREDAQEETKDAAVGRLAELDAVFHAIDMVPSQVTTLEGAGWVAALSSPIPRFIWRDKPTTNSSVDQRYAVVFKRQSEVGARSTAILLPLVVEGYWNFEWFGVALSCFVMGLWCGVLQKLFAGPHWALRAMGVAHLSRLIAQGAVSGLFAGIFQHLTGLLLACWLVYGIHKILTRTAKTAARPTRSVAFAPARRLPRAPPGGPSIH